MKRAHVVFVVGIAIAIAIPVGLLVYKSKRTASLDDYLVERGFKRERCTPEIVAGATESTCYAGTIVGRPTTFSFVTRLTPGYNPNASHVASKGVVVIALTLSDGTVKTTRYEQVWSANDAREHLERMEKELTKSPR